MFSIHIHSNSFIIFCCIATLVNSVYAKEPSNDAIELTNKFLGKSLPDLMDEEVSTLARKPQTVENTPAAAFVINAEDIRRSGATSLPDILRMVPGIDVAKMNSSNWAVSARGFNDLYANKLQVMIDGRSIYDPLVSGVYWGQQNPFLQDIERIEVIRGPSGTLWGANAVNGTINIVTRNASETEGSLVTAGGGNKQQSGGFRYGARLSESTFIRTSINGNYNDAGIDANGIHKTGDYGETENGNFRLDSRLDDENKLMLQGNVTNYDLNGSYIGISTQTPLTWNDNKYGRNGINASMQGSWSHHTNEGHDWKLNLAFTYTDWNLAIARMSRSTYLVDFHDSLPKWGRHNFLWGVNYQNVSDQFTNSLTIGFYPEIFSQNNFGVFFQDEIEMADNLKLTLANRVEHFTFTGWETEPNARLMLTANKQHSFWAAISRSVVVPNRAQHGIGLFVPVPGHYSPGNSVFVDIRANPGMKTENLLAYELGWRWQVANNLDIDTALFYNIYDRMLGTIFSGGVAGAPGGIILSSVSGNYRQVTTYGAEVSLNYRINTDWRLQASYSNIYFDTHYDLNINWFRDPLTERNSDPQQSMSLRSQFDVTNEIEFDVWGRYVDQLRITTGKIPGYFALDLRMGWHPRKDLELSLIGQNLLDNQHPEFLDKVYIPTASQIQRSYFAQITWHF